MQRVTNISIETRGKEKKEWKRCKRLANISIKSIHQKHQHKMHMEMCGAWTMIAHIIGLECCASKMGMDHDSLFVGRADHIG